MAVDFKTFVPQAHIVADVGLPILIRGRHGIGKSAVVYQFAASRALPVVERRASQMTEGDLLGLPSTDGDVTTFNPPDWFHKACVEPVILFLDEVDRATTEVRQGIFELCDSRKIAGHALHPGTLIFAAINGGENGAQYQVSEMDPAELDRYTTYDIEPTVEDWLDWGKDNVSGVIWDFVNQNRQHLEHNDDYEPNKVYPSRRSWHRFSDAANNAGLLNESSSTLYTLASAFLGLEAAVAFNDFVRNYERQVTIEDLIDHGKFDLITDWEINDFTSFVEKLGAANLFEGTLTDDQFQNFVNFFDRCPAEVACKLFASLPQWAGASEDPEKVSQIMTRLTSVKGDVSNLSANEKFVTFIQDNPEVLTQE